MSTDNIFKPKSIKKAPISKTTLDAIHKEQIHGYLSESDNLNIYKKELEELEKQLEIPECKNIYEIENKCSSLRNKISKLKNNNELMDYYLKTGNLLYEYYNVQDKISQGNIIKNKSKNKQGTIFAALEEAASISENIHETVVTFTYNTQSTIYQNNNEHNDNNINDGISLYAREKLLDKYLQIVDPEIAKNFITDSEEKWSECPNCNKDMIFNMNEAYISCSACGYQDFVLIDSDKPSYKDPPREVSYYAYKRINHFNEWLAQFQAKESTEIPQEVFDAILFELKKERITNMATLKRSTLREILKKIKFNKY